MKSGWEGGAMTWLHRGTIFVYAFMAASSAYSASLPTGHGWHVAAAVCWVGLAALAWHNGRLDARLREAARLSSMADGMASVAGGVERMTREIGPVAYDIAAAAYGAAAEKRTEALAVLGSKP